MPDTPYRDTVAQYRTLPSARVGRPGCTLVQYRAPRSTPVAPYASAVPGMHRTRISVPYAISVAPYATLVPRRLIGGVPDRTQAEPAGSRIIRYVSTGQRVGRA
eukprot:3941400-Rhodomonas_salina.1